METVSAALVNRRLVTVRDGNSVYSGGDQDWLATGFQRNTGCGSVSLTQQLLYFTLRRDGRTEEGVAREEFLETYYRCFGGVGKPLSLIATAGAYARLGKRLLGEAGFDVTPVGGSTMTLSVEEAWERVVAGLSADRPVALQNWWCHKDVRAWHWVTIVAAEASPEREPTVEVSTWGRLKTYRFRDAWTGKASLVYFQ